MRGFRRARSLNSEIRLRSINTGTNLPINPLYKKLIIAAVLLLAYSVMRFTQTTFGDLWDMARGEFEQKRAETHEYRDSNFSDRVSKEMRDTAKNMPGAQTETPTGVDGELNNELAVERKRMMDEGARVAEQNREKMMKGDAETLKKRERRNLLDSEGNK